MAKDSTKIVIRFREDSEEWRLLNQIKESYPNMSYTDIIKRMVNDYRIKTEYANNQNQITSTGLNIQDCCNQGYDRGLIMFVNDCIVNDLIDDALFIGFYYDMYRQYIDRFKRDDLITFNIMPYKNFGKQLFELLHKVNPSYVYSWHVDDCQSTISWSTFLRHYRYDIPLATIYAQYDFNDDTKITSYKRGGYIFTQK